MQHACAVWSWIVHSSGNVDKLVTSTDGANHGRSPGGWGSGARRRRREDHGPGNFGPLGNGVWGLVRFLSKIVKISATFCSFSAVSAPIFASKYAFFSIFQKLPDYLADIFEIWQNFAVFATLILQNVCWIFTKIADFQTDFFAKILRLQRCKSVQIF